MGRSLKSQPFFIIGVDRSGTTLLSLMLDTHSEIAIPNESHFFIKYYQLFYHTEAFSSITFKKSLVNDILNEPYVQKWEAHLSPEDIDFSICTGLAQTIDAIFTAYAQKRQKKIWGDKTPEYVTHLDILNRMFPSCRFIHLVRDGRDVAASIVKQWWGANDFLSAIRSWARRVEISTKMLGMLPQERYLTLRFEDLLQNPEAEIKKITRFLGVKFENTMVESYSFNAAKKVGDMISDHHKLLLQRPMISRAFNWKNSLSPPDQALASEIAGEMLQLYGYEPGITTHPMKLLRKAYFRIQESFAWRLEKKRS